MGIKVKARQTKLSVGPSKGEYRFIMQAEIYSTLKQEKVISEASIRSGIPKGSLQAAWEAIGEVVKAWTTEGHSVALPGVGYHALRPASRGCLQSGRCRYGTHHHSQGHFHSQYHHQAGTEGYLHQHHLLRQGRKSHQTGDFVRPGQCG